MRTRPVQGTVEEGIADVVNAEKAQVLALGIHREHFLDRFRDPLNIRQNFAQQERGEEPSNALAAEQLNPLRRRFLMEALETVIELQEHVYEEYGGVPVG